ncbi:hypothetical protein ACN47E_007660 [Coniothyrium glycines]
MPAFHNARAGNVHISIVLLHAVATGLHNYGHGLVCAMDDGQAILCGQRGQHQIVFWQCTAQFLLHRWILFDTRPYYV